MNRAARFLAVALVTLAAGGCSHGTVSQLPTAPTPPVVLRALTITPGGGALYLGTVVPISSEGQQSSGTFGAFGIYTDGSAHYVKAVWTSSDSNVLSVDGVQIVAMGRGTATLTATVDSMKAAVDFTVEPGIEGSWSGTYVVDVCDAGAGSIYEVVCSASSPGRQGGVFPVGTVAPISLKIIESNSKDLTAAAAFGEWRGTLTGTDRGANVLTLTGDLLNANGSKISVVFWDAQVRTDVMEGNIAFEVRVPGLPNSAQVSAHFANLSRR